MIKHFWGALLCLAFVSCSSKKAVTGTDAKAGVFYSGVDVSYINQVEAYGGVYRVNGRARDPFRIFREQGINTIRVRLWHDPAWTRELNDGKAYSDLEDVIRTIRRAKEIGMMVNLDLHYSDDWADPSRQTTPDAWKYTTLPVLEDSVYSYTLGVLCRLQQLNLVPEMVQVGNENNHGILFPVGKVVNDNWEPFARLLQSGIRAVRDFSTGSPIKPRIILHVAQVQHAGNWLYQLSRHGVKDFDIIGLSHYFKWSGVNDFKSLSDSLAAYRKQYAKDVMIVETAYPWTSSNADQYPNVIPGTDTLPGYPASPSGQAKYLSDLCRAVRQGGGQGVMYWEPAWISSRLRDQWGTGSSWDNCTLFDFNGNVLPGMKRLGH